MPIHRVTADQVTQVRQLWQRSRYLYHNLGAEDLAALLTQQIALLAAEQEQPWGFLCIQDEPRPATLPAAAPTRAYLRALALARGRAPSLYVSDLLNAALPHFQPSPQGHLLIVYADADWLRPPLFGAGFALTEEVQYFELSRLQRWQPINLPSTPAFTLRPGQSADLAPLAVVDAAAFSPLWHFDSAMLRELLLTSRLQVALHHDTLVGYTALTSGADSAHLARLAIHPEWQGRGWGKVLLDDALHYAQTAGIQTVMLNTQVHNRPAQQLYRAIGFRPTGRITPVLTRFIANQQPAPPTFPTGRPTLA
jgi:ribosomal-protein-alanine N-acetyltransferase